MRRGKRSPNEYRSCLLPGVARQSRYSRQALRRRSLILKGLGGGAWIIYKRSFCLRICCVAYQIFTQIKTASRLPINVWTICMPTSSRALQYLIQLPPHPIRRLHAPRCLRIPFIHFQCLVKAPRNYWKTIGHQFPLWISTDANMVSPGSSLNVFRTHIQSSKVRSFILSRLKFHSVEVALDLRYPGRPICLKETKLIEITYTGSREISVGRCSVSVIQAGLRRGMALPRRCASKCGPQLVRPRCLWFEACGR
jgi:hypothetical protein